MVLTGILGLILGVILGAYLTSQYGGVGQAAREATDRIRENAPETETVMEVFRAIGLFLKKHLAFVLLFLAVVVVLGFVFWPRPVAPITYNVGDVLTLQDGCGNQYNVTLTQEIVALRVVTVGAGVRGQNSKECALAYSIAGDEFQK